MLENSIYKIEISSKKLSNLVLRVRDYCIQLDFKFRFLLFSFHFIILIFIPTKFIQPIISFDLSYLKFKNSLFAAHLFKNNHKMMCIAFKFCKLFSHFWKAKKIIYNF